MATDRLSQEVLETVKSFDVGTTRLSQETLEVIKTLSGTPVRMTQEVLEVVKANNPFVASCPTSLAYVGVIYVHTVIPGGGTGPYTFALTAGALPPGLTLNTTTGVVSGTPTTIGTYDYTVTVTDSLMATSVNDCEIIVIVAPPTPALAPTQCPLNTEQVSSITLACPVLGTPAVVGIAYSKQMVATGGTAPLSFLLTVGPLPTGLSLDPLTGIISGTPTVVGTYPFTIQVVDNDGATAMVSCTIQILSSSVLSVTCPISGSTATVDVPYTGTFIGSGGTPPYTFAITGGTLPPGITLTGDTLSGTPTDVGTYDYTVTITDSLGVTSPTDCEIIVSPPTPPEPPPAP